MAKDKDGNEIVETVVSVQTDKTVDGKTEDIMIPKARLDEVLEKNRVLEQKQKKRDEADVEKQKKADEEAGNFKKLAADAAKERDDARKELLDAQRYNLFLQEAAKVGIVDPQVAYTALPVAVEGEKMDVLVAQLVEMKPYFIMQVEMKNGVPVVKSGGGHKPPVVDPKAALEAAYADAMKNHKPELAIQIKRQILELTPKP